MTKRDRKDGIARREAILERLRIKETVSVKELAGEFGVSEMTVHRDLHFLEEQGKVLLHYGGASLRNARLSFGDYDLRQKDEYKGKIAIARKAAGMLKEQDVVYLDMSSTVSLMTRFLPDVHLTVITASRQIIDACCMNPEIRLYAAPGLYSPAYGGFSDVSTIGYLAGFHYHKAFLGTSNFDSASGAYAPEEMESAVKRSVMRNTEKTYLLADHSKFGKTALTKIGDIKDFEAVITDSETDPEETARIRQNGGRILVAEILP